MLNRRENVKTKNPQTKLTQSKHNPKTVKSESRNHSLRENDIKMSGNDPFAKGKTKTNASFDNKLYSGKDGVNFHLHEIPEIEEIIQEKRSRNEVIFHKKNKSTQKRPNYDIQYGNVLENISITLNEYKSGIQALKANIEDFKYKQNENIILNEISHHPNQLIKDISDRLNTKQIENTNKSQQEHSESPKSQDFKKPNFQLTKSSPLHKSPQNSKGEKKEKILIRESKYSIKKAYRNNERNIRNPGMHKTNSESLSHHSGSPNSKTPQNRDRDRNANNIEIKESIHEAGVHVNGSGSGSMLGEEESEADCEGRVSKQKRDILNNKSVYERILSQTYKFKPIMLSTSSAMPPQTHISRNPRYHVNLNSNPQIKLNIIDQNLHLRASQVKKRILYHIRSKSLQRDAMIANKTARTELVLPQAPGASVLSGVCLPPPPNSQRRGAKCPIKPHFISQNHNNSQINCTKDKLNVKESTAVQKKEENGLWDSPVGESTNSFQFSNLKIPVICNQSRNFRNHNHFAKNEGRKAGSFSQNNNNNIMNYNLRNSHKTSVHYDSSLSLFSRNEMRKLTESAKDHDLLAIEPYSLPLNTHIIQNSNKRKLS
jgi:hypothetical protein